MTRDDDTITLKDAAEHFHYTVWTLRAEAERGRLTIYKIGKRYYTTPADIREMVKKCRVEQRVRGSISTLKDTNGLSETAHISAAQAALSQMLNGRKSSSQSTSEGSTGRRRQASR